MTFGTDGHLGSWGAEEAAGRAVFDRYIAAGGNFIDTADLYSKGTSETLLGKFIADSRSRHRLVVATKYSYSVESGDPNAGGNLSDVPAWYAARAQTWAEDEEVSAPPIPYPYGMFTDGYQAAYLHTGAVVADKPREYAPIMSGEASTSAT